MQGVLVRKENNLRVVLTVEPIRSSVSAEVDEADLEPLGVHSIQSCRVPLLQGQCRLTDRTRCERSRRCGDAVLHLD